MELSNYQAFMECMRKWEKIGCNILCGLALWEQMQDCDRRGVPYTDIDIEAVSQDVAYRLMMSHDRLYALALHEWTEQHFAQNSHPEMIPNPYRTKGLPLTLSTIPKEFLRGLQGRKTRKMIPGTYKKYSLSCHTGRTAERSV